MLSTQVELVYGNREIQCLIDLSLPVADIVRTLCLDQLNLPDELGRYALRLASTLELITDDVSKRYKNIMNEFINTLFIYYY
jgi:hypothetical protein